MRDDFHDNCVKIHVILLTFLFEILILPEYWKNLIKLAKGNSILQQSEPFAQVEFLNAAFQKTIHLKSYTTLDPVLKTAIDL